MTITADEFEYCKVRVNYVADTDLVLEKREEVFENIKNANVKVPGFRQSPSKRAKRKKKGRKSSALDGKAYEISLKKRYAKYIEEQVTKQLVAEAYDETLYETKMKPLSYPEVVHAELDEENFECEMVFMKKPDFELGQYKGFEIPEPHQEETAPMRAEKMLQSLREKHGDTIIYNENDFVQDGDTVTMSVKATCDGNVVESLTKEGLTYKLGSNTFYEFDQNLYGMKSSNERTFDIVFPDKEEINEEIRGKRVTFEVRLHAGTKTVPAPLNDEFAKKLGYDNIKKMHDEAISTASSQLQRSRQQMIANQVLRRILDNHDFKVPHWHVFMESEAALKQLGTDWGQLSKAEATNINKQSENKIKLSLILDSIRDAEPESVFSDAEIINNMRRNIEENGGNPDEVLSRAQNDGTLIGLVAKLKDEATIQWLIEQSTIIDGAKQDIENKESKQQEEEEVNQNG